MHFLQCSGPWNLLCCYRVTLEDGQLSQFGKLNKGNSKAFQVPWTELALEPGDKDNACVVLEIFVGRYG